jgi:hypothetical protein
MATKRKMQSILLFKLLLLNFIVAKLLFGPPGQSIKFITQQHSLVGYNDAAFSIRL